jgi:hypothetical protein
MHITVDHLPHADIDPIDERPTYRLMMRWNCVLKLDGRMHLFIIPLFYLYDGASVPVWARWLIERDGVHRESALLHDYLYENKGYLKLGDDAFYYNRKDADQIFRECLKSQGLASWKVFLMYNAVRLGGKSYWDN